MSMKKYLTLSFVTVITLLAMPLAAAEMGIYGHISFVDSGALVMREDGSKDQAMVNLPLAPGDTVITSAGGRCELQFDNGTVIRLDKGSRLRLATILAPSLTSDWKITTLELERGQLYALPQSYSREMFQVVTPNAAANLKSRVRATIRLDSDGGTSFFSDGGKFQLLYGADVRSLKIATVRSDRPLAITAASVPAAGVEARDIEFRAWNEYVDKHFKELHYGISKVPSKLKFGNTALTYWAEKWSSIFGEWIYDELFGYVWRPADDRFAFAERPFFHADFARVGDVLFLVPQQSWGWVPAHMGTWVWMKRGWTWIPGDWFHSGVVDYMGLYSFPINSHYYSFPTFDYYWHRYWHAQPGWPKGYLHRPGMPGLPGPVIGLLKKVGKVPASHEGRRLAVEKAVTPIEGVKLPPAPNRPRMQMPVPGSVVKAGALPILKNGAPAGPDASVLKRDWNPDSRWATRRFVTIHYAGNAVVCPELKLSSDDLRGVERVMLRDSARLHGPGSSTTRSQSDSSSSSTSADRAANGSQGNSGERVKTDDGKGK
ncbi:MAG: FecR family protein [Acidobacteria bacterium]|jgi:hypothetical protein|nr:FecR family protein [Acidobacteriota bacterium]